MKKVLVTGGTQGVGLETVKLLVEPMCWSKTLASLWRLG